MTSGNDDQYDLFGPVPAVSPPAGRASPPSKQRGARPTGVTAEVAHQVLADIAQNRFGLLDDTDRVVLFEDTDRVRLALDEDAVHALISSGHIHRGPARDVVTCRHGAIRRPVTPLRLTRRGRDLLARWSALQPLNRETPSTVKGGETP